MTRNPPKVIHPPRTKRGFSLVELSIVLVILGLLVGGILAGQSLIRAAELRSVTTDITRYGTAIATFRDKYFALPGDMTNATAFWGKDNTNCAGNTGTAATNGTCNGNGDSTLAAGAGVGATAEIFQFWKQLSLAGLVEGTFTGLSDPGGSATGRSANPGYNVPRSRIGNKVGFSIEFWPDTTATGSVMWIGSYRNFYIFGAAASACCPTESPALKPEEAWNVDSKIDDGKPAQGKVRTFYRYSYETVNGMTSHCSTTDVEATAAYDLSNTNVVCGLVITTGY
ncbi:MAG: type II secretion system protein [Rickettsiales bacterium]